MVAILSAILIHFCPTKPVFDLEPEFDRSNPYMNFEINPIKISKLERPQQRMDGQTEGGAKNKIAPKNDFVFISSVRPFKDYNF